MAERLTPTSFPVLTVSVEGALPPERLRDVALYQVRPALSRVAGVGPISVTAGEVREVEVEIDPARAEAAGLTADGIAARLAASNTYATVGRADIAYRRYAVVVSGVASSLARLGDFVVGGSERAPVRLADVATIVDGHADPRLLVRSPRGASAVVNVARRIGGDVVALDAGLRRRARRAAHRGADRRRAHAGLRAGHAHRRRHRGGARRDPPRRAALGDRDAASFCARRGRRWWRRWQSRRRWRRRAPSFGMTGGSLNLMSLGGLAIAVGLVIDDAVVVVEAIHRALAAGLSPREAAVAGTRELCRPGRSPRR